MDRVKKLYIVTLVLILGGGSIAVAEDLVPPPWQRGAEGSTHQAWEFDIPGAAGLYIEPDPGWVNPYGIPGLNVDTPHAWMQELDQRTGIWPLSGEIDIEIPNREGGPEKHIWIQLTWKSAMDVPGINPKPYIPFQPNIGVTTLPLYESMMISNGGEIDLGNGWTHSTFKVDIWPNPTIEWLTIKGNILVDELVVDTICIPEPATMALLGIGGFLCLRRRKRTS